VWFVRVWFMCGVCRVNSVCVFVACVLCMCVCGVRFCSFYVVCLFLFVVC